MQPTDPHGRQARRPGIWTGILIGVLVAAVAALVAYIYLGQEDDPAVAIPSPSQTPPSAPPTPSAAPPPSPSPTSGSERPASEVRGSFNARDGFAEGERLTFGVMWQDFPDDECSTHTYTTGDRIRGAFLSDCVEWEDAGHDILIFYISFENTSDRSIRIRRSNLVLVSRDERSFGPIDVRSEAEFPTSFLSANVLVPPGARWRGAVTFDGHVTGMVPDRLTYLDGAQTLTQVFKGRHGIAEPG